MVILKDSASIRRADPLKTILGGGLLAGLLDGLDAALIIGVLGIVFAAQPHLRAYLFVGIPIAMMASRSAKQN